MDEKKSTQVGNVIRQLYFCGDLSCAELSWKLDKSIPITTRILNELIEEGKVKESGLAPSTGGRRPTMYAVKPDLLYTISIAMDQLVSRIGIMDMQNRYVTGIEKFELPLSKGGEALTILIQKIEIIIKRSGIPKQKFAGIGIGMPGFVDGAKGVNYSFLQLPGKTINTAIAEKIGIPVFIENDSSLIALAELRFGSAKNKKNSMVVNLGWGIGLGMVVNGELFRGHNGFAGEFSHIPLFLNGKLCSCGKRGCLETETSMLVLIEKAREGLQSGRVSMMKSLSRHSEEASESIFHALKEDDLFAIELLSQIGYNIGRGIAILIHLMNPEQVILSGRGSKAGRLWLAPIQQALNEHCISRLSANTVIEISNLGYEAELIGAAALVMEHYENNEFKQKAIQHLN